MIDRYFICYMLKLDRVLHKLYLFSRACSLSPRNTPALICYLSSMVAKWLGPIVQEPSNNLAQRDLVNTILMEAPML